ncbi:lipoprotein [Roseivivax marinus]|uniref:Lipoprotein n=1 Tax=Roseivivax marinus TaxID=1379903 RepID=W4HH48_9RHOB|nr:YjbF family lipoprotein [Roseivivax marinus]ETW12077.1 lipoprotein [Roseivivax marinus]
MRPTKTLRRRAIAALAAAGLLAACSTEKESVNALDVFGELRAKLSNANPPPLSEAQIRQSLAAVPGPIRFLEVGNRGGQALIAPIGQNGDYVTWASAGGQNVVFRNGFAVQSRGLGGDLMSSDEDALLPLIRARRQGTAPYVMRFLSGDNDTIVYNYTCNVLPRGATDYAAGEINGNATAVEVHCVSETGLDHVSRYVVSSDGYVLSGEQWFGQLTETLTYRTLR